MLRLKDRLINLKREFYRKVDKSQKKLTLVAKKGKTKSIKRIKKFNVNFIGAANTELELKYNKRIFLDTILLALVAIIYMGRVGYLVSNDQLLDHFKSFWFPELISFILYRGYVKFSALVYNPSDFFEREIKNAKTLEKILKNSYKSRRRISVLFLFFNIYLAIVIFKLDDDINWILSHYVPIIYSYIRNFTVYIVSILSTVIVNTIYGVLGNFAFHYIQEKRNKKNDDSD